MPITPQNLVRHELIGLKVSAKSSGSQPMRGTVVDETHNMLTIQTAAGERSVPKKGAVFTFTLPDRIRVQVDGNLLISRPEDRIKKKFPRW